MKTPWWEGLTAALLYAAVAIGFTATIWWFFGRKPHVEISDPSDSILIYAEPTLFGWERRGLAYLLTVPEEYEYEAEGWWHTKHLAVSPDEIPDLDLTDVVAALEELETYYVWKPIPY